MVAISLPGKSGFGRRLVIIATGYDIIVLLLIEVCEAHGSNPLVATLWFLKNRLSILDIANRLHDNAFLQ